MTRRMAFMRFNVAGAVAVALAAACSSARSTPGDSTSGMDSADAATSEASSSPPEDAAARDATADTSRGDSPPTDSGPAGNDDGSPEDAASMLDAARADGGASPDSAGGATALDQACSALCAGQSKLSCSQDVADCQSNCVMQADDTENPSISCESKYVAMAECEAKLPANQWVCSETNVVPIPVPGKCTSTLCAWSCCVGSDYADPDIWASCMAGCP